VRHCPIRMAMEGCRFGGKKWKEHARVKEPSIVPWAESYVLLLLPQVIKAGARYKWFKKGGAKKAEATTAATKTRFYPADDVPKPLTSSRNKHKVRPLSFII